MFWRGRNLDCNSKVNLSRTSSDSWGSQNAPYNVQDLQSPKLGGGRGLSTSPKQDLPSPFQPFCSQHGAGMCFYSRGSEEVLL